MTDRWESLTQAAEEVLCDGLFPPLKATIKELLQKGHSKREIMAAITASVRRHAMPGQGRLTIAACNAYCDRALRGST